VPTTPHKTLVVPTFRAGRWAVPVLAVLLLTARPVAAEKMSKEDEQWLHEVQVLILPEEEQVYRDLAAQDRPEFRNLFWARRNPNGPTAEANPARDGFEKARAEANHRFKHYGADSDCTEMLLLLGKPDTERSKARPLVLGSGGAGREDTIVRQWVYHELKGERLPPEGLVLGFDESCRMNPEARRRLWSALQPRHASASIVNPSVQIRLDEEKHLVPLERQLSQPDPAQALLLSPRQDFPIADDVVYMRSASGEAAILGVLQGRLADTTPATARKMAVRAEELSSQGDVVASTEREVSVHPAADGSFVAAFGLLSKPGAFTLRAGIIEPDGQHGTALSHPVDVPDFTGKHLTSSTLMFIENVVPVTDAADDDPLAPFVMGPYRLVPRVGHSFHRNETMLLIASCYGSQADATGKAKITGTLDILQDGKPAAKRMEQAIDVPDGTLAFGPLPLQPFSPGRYEAQLLIKDENSKQETTARGTFEVVP
jgi:GWxTD domain-containing protein